MSKRFTETTKWRDPWFRKLTLRAKALFLWLVDNCDNAGVLDVDLEAASFDIGEAIEMPHLAELDSRLKKLDNGKISLLKFVPFQFGKLSGASRVHHSVMRLLESHGLQDEVECSDDLIPIRQKITASFKDKVFALDEFRCQWCGSSKGRDDLVLDHVLPVSLGGAKTTDNLVSCCLPCNQSKYDMHPLEFRAKHGKQTLQRLSAILDVISKSQDRVSRVMDTPKEKEKEKEQAKAPEKAKGGVGGDGALDPVFVRDLMATYRRAADSRLSHLEESTLAEIIRERPRYRAEWDIIITLRQKEPRYFPQSLYKLLSGWQDTLDRATNHVPASASKTASTVFEITKVIEAKTKLADDLKHKHASEGALSTDWSPPEKRIEHAALRGEIKKLTNQLASMA